MSDNKSDDVTNGVTEKEVELQSLRTDSMDNAATSEDAVEGRIGLLLGAASKNDVRRMLRLLRSGAAGMGPDAADYDKRTALHLAASEGHLEATKLLIEEGANPNLKDRFGQSALDEAIRAKHDEVVAYLKDNGATLGAVNQHEGNLIQAANDNNVELAQNLIDNGVNPNCADYDRRTPLHLATASGNLEIVEMLLKAGADPKAADRWGGSPLDEVSRHAVRTGVNHMQALFETYGHIKAHEPVYFSAFSVFFAIAEIVVIVLMCIFTTYGPTHPTVTQETAEAEQLQAALAGSSLAVQELNRYAFLQDVNVMIFVGFGYLMTFLKKNAYNSVGLTFLIAAFCVQWHILVNGFFHQVFEAKGFHLIKVTSDNIILGDFSAGAVLITYGVLLGKVSPFQMLCIAILEMIFFVVNENIGLVMNITDIGGSMVIHMFGAYFGMAASLALKRKDASDNDSNAAVYHSDMFAMIGTIFLWMFWPSFNAAMGLGDQQHRAVLNTGLSLAGSCVAAYIASHIFRAEKRFNMVDIQNATLAGGVAMGTAADMAMGPGFAILIGAIGGVVSVVGYVYLQPVLEEKLGFHDTCGVNNLHGLPSIVGAICGSIISCFATEAIYGNSFANTFGAVAAGERTAAEQGSYQIAFMFITLAMSLVGGGITGSIVNSAKFDPVKTENLFEDSAYWEVPELEQPYYFDHRGEIARGDSGSEGKSGVENRVKRVEEQLDLIDIKLKDNRKSTVAMAQSGSSSKMEILFERLLRKIDKDE